MSEFAQTDLPDRIRNTNLPLESAIVAGSATLEMLGIRRAQDLDVIVPEEVYTHLRGLHDFEEVINPNSGFRHLSRGDLDIATQYDGKNTDQLRQTSYTHGGITYTGLPDIYAAKQTRGSEKDTRDLENIRQYLYGDKPLPKAVLGSDLSFVQGIIPERLRDHPAVHVAANGLYIVRTIFGHEGETVRSYSGSVEKGSVPATYHGWEHSALGAKDGQESMDREDAELRQQGKPPLSDNDRLSGLGFTNHDVHLGHGRKSANPEAHDEKQSAELVVRHLESAGVTDEQLLRGSYETVIVTTFNEALKAQDIDPARGHLPEQQRGAAMDMSTFRRPDGPRNAVRLAPEDLARTGAGYDAPLDRLVKQLNAELPEGTPPIRINNDEDGLRLIEQYPDFPVIKQTPDGPQHMTLLQALGTHIKGSGGFCGNYLFPANWKAGDPELQGQNAATLKQWGQGIKNGTILPTQLPQLAQAYRDAHLAAGKLRNAAHDSDKNPSAKEFGAEDTDALLQLLHDILRTME